jgi:hypothetical protein
MFDFDTAAMSSNDITVHLGKLVDIADHWPPSQNGHGVLANPAALLDEAKEAYSSLGAAISLLAKTTWPAAEDYHRAADAARNRRVAR